MSYHYYYNKDHELDFPYYVTLTRTDISDSLSDHPTLWRTVVGCDDLKQAEEIQQEAERNGMYRNIKITEHKPAYNYKYDHTVSFCRYVLMMMIIAL